MAAGSGGLGISTRRERSQSGDLICPASILLHKSGSQEVHSGRSCIQLAREDVEDECVRPTRNTGTRPAVKSGEDGTEEAGGKTQRCRRLSLLQLSVAKGIELVGWGK